MSGVRIAVIGAGVFGAWTAHHLQKRGASVVLVDGYGPANSLASSGGESRVTRAAYGKDAIYSRMAMDSLPAWKALSASSGLPIFHETGVLFFFDSIDDDYLRETVAVHRELGLPSELLDRGDLDRRYPAIDFSGVASGLFEPGFGALMARRAVQTLVEQVIRAGAGYRLAAARIDEAPGDRIDHLRLSTGEELHADQFVFALGPWFPKVFPELIGRRIQPTRQEIFFFAPPPGDSRFSAPQLPVWADFNGGDMYYGFPDLEGRGVKFAHYTNGEPVDPDTQDRQITQERLAEIIAFRDRRFPLLRGAPLTEARVCQYENSSNGDFLIDFHPRHPNVLLVGGGSGHGFKHGPEVGRYAAGLIFGDTTPEPRFSLESKSEVHRREVH